MAEATIALKGKPLRNFPKLKEQLAQLGFTSVSSRKDRLELEKIETSDLKGRPQHSYHVLFHKEKLVFTYSIGPDRISRDLEALGVLMNLITLSQDYYLVHAGELRGPVSAFLNHVKPLIGSEGYASTHELATLEEKFHSLDRKYRDLVLSSEQNARILLECEKKKSEYYSRIKSLESMSDQTLTHEIFKWLKTHSGEINIPHFSKSYDVPTARVEEGLELLLKKGYIKKK